jgi:hypothetical protein
MTPEDIMRDLARDDIFPKAAMAAARVDRDTMAPVLIDLINRLTSQRIAAMDDRDVIALIPAFHLLGEWRETRAYRPILTLLRQPTRILDHLLGDALTETAFRVVAGTFDGDLQPLFEAILDRKADEFARSSLMSALVMIAQLHPEHRAAIDAFFRSFLTRFPEAPEDVLTGWMDVIADLGLEDMTEDVRALFETGLIPPEYCDFGHFLEDLQATLDSGGIPGNRRYRQALITDAIHELSRWHCYTDEFFARQREYKVRNALRVAPWTEAIAAPIAKIGRNDPCPCGSGKKFKKCCLH